MFRNFRYSNDIDRTDDNIQEGQAWVKANVFVHIHQVITTNEHGQTTNRAIVLHIVVLLSTTIFGQAYVRCTFATNAYIDI